MALSSLLASGTTAANSADVVLADGSSATLIVRDVGRVLVEIKNASGTYQLVGDIRSDSNVAKQISGPVTFRIRREVSLTSVGVDIDKT